jgi:hypothetical protein
MTSAMVLNGANDYTDTSTLHHPQTQQDIRYDHNS